MVSSELCAKALGLGSSYLSEVQQEDGGFISLSSPERDNFSRAVYYRTTFANSFILQVLNEIGTDVVRENLNNFLLQQRSSQWSFNYWCIDSIERETMGYPDDLDDTFAAITAIAGMNTGILDGEVFAQIVTILASCEAAEGGPYRTWLVDSSVDGVWQDVDVAVNANIAYFLSRQDIVLEPLEVFLKECIIDDKISSSYYPSVIPIIYFLSRYPFGNEIREILLMNVKCELAGAMRRHSDLDIALCVCAMINMDFNDCDVYVSTLLQSQREDGSWRAGGFCIDPSQDDVKYYSGSSALTTAFCMLAIHGFLEKNNNQSAVTEVANTVLPLQALINDVVGRCETIFAGCSTDVTIEAERLINLFIKKDKQFAITLLPYFLWESLIDDAKNNIARSDLVDLCVISVLGWVACGIYDDFLDLEGQAHQLPIANIALRAMVRLVDAMDCELANLFHQIMNGLESANHWEVTNARVKVGGEINLPDWGDTSRLCERSMGHAFGGASLLLKLGYADDSVEMRTYLSFFKHFIIAKQLNDDAHDWKEDLAHGMLTPVVSGVLASVSRDKWNQLDVLEQSFWEYSIVGVCDQVLFHVASARGALEVLGTIFNTELFESMIEPYEAIVKKTLDERDNVMKFLKAL